MHNVGARSGFPLRCCCGARHRIHALRGGWRQPAAPAGAAEAMAGDARAWHRPCDDNKCFACIWTQRYARIASFGCLLVAGGGGGVEEEEEEEEEEDSPP